MTSVGMESTSSTISVKLAVEKAMGYVRDLYQGERLRDLLLEEVELSEKQNQWLVSVGFSLPKEEPVAIISPSRPLARHYKVVRIDAETGEPLSMKIRDI
jgi:hypothetical protein